jgi:hypothetical protein
LFDVADLSTVWVQAQLYEDDLAYLPAGGHQPASGAPTFQMPVRALVRAFPNKPFDGALSFIFPHVDPETRTLTVRFELPNPDHELRPGMTATVTLNLTPELLAKTPGGSRLQTKDGKVFAVPEASVIDTGEQKVVYRESVPNTFEGVKVELGGKMITPDGAVYYPVLSGLAEDDRVVTSGSFLIDAETHLNPAMASVYIGGSGGKPGPAVVRPSTPDDQAALIAANMASLPKDDRTRAQAQRICPIRNELLGLMGKPVKLVFDGRSFFVCCKSCVGEAKAEPRQMLTRVENLRTKAPSAPLPQSPATPAPPPELKLSGEQLAEIEKNLAALGPADQALARAQKLCPVQRKPLGLMGPPVKVDLGGGRAVFVCCDGCNKKATQDPETMLKRVSEFQAGIGARP